MPNQKLIITSLCSVMIVGCSTDSASWMQDSSGAINNKNITQLIIPGSHIANAYDIDQEDTKCIGETLPQSYSNNAQIQQQLINNPNQLSIFTSQLNTQDDDISSQLTKGIRYLDIQICGQDNQFYTSNLYLTDKFSLIAEQIQQFIGKHPEEIIIIDFDNNLRDEHGYMDSQAINTFHDYLKTTFGSLIATKDDLHKSIKELKNHHHQIIIISSNPELSSYPDIWNKNQIALTTDAQSSTIKKLSIMEAALGSNVNITQNKLNIVPLYSEITIETLDDGMDGSDVAQAIILNYLQLNIGNHPSILVTNKTFAPIVEELVIRQDINNIVKIESSIITAQNAESTPTATVSSLPPSTIESKK